MQAMSDTSANLLRRIGDLLDGSPFRCDECGEEYPSGGLGPIEVAWRKIDNTIIQHCAFCNDVSQRLMAEACDACSSPGACCKGFPLVGVTTHQTVTMTTRIEAMIWAAQQIYLDPNRERWFLGLPFVPVRRMYDDARMPDDTWLWTCVDLLPNGRCGNYENRPYGPCVIYKPGQDRMCTVHPEFEPWL